MKTSEEFRGTRIYLRELNHGDVTERYLSWFRDPEVTRFLEARNLQHSDVTEHMDYGMITGTYFMYAICLVQSNLHIGNLKIGPIEQRHGLSNLVTVIGDKAYWGLGLGTEAIRLGARMAFEIYDIRKLYACIYSENIGSIKCYTKAGWFEDGRLSKHYIVEGQPVDGVYVCCFNPNLDSPDRKQEAVTA